MVPVLLIAIVILALATSVVLVAVNARVVTHLRRNHAALYKSIGSPGWLWNWPSNRNRTLYFVFGSQWANLIDPGLEDLCRLSRKIAIAHFSFCAAGLLTILAGVVHWLFS
jgi:hypothetical protein